MNKKKEKDKKNKRYPKLDALRHTADSRRALSWKPVSTKINISINHVVIVVDVSNDVGSAGGGITVAPRPTYKESDPFETPNLVKYPVRTHARSIPSISQKPS